jgi:hypothetical protein
MKSLFMTLSLFVGCTLICGSVTSTSFAAEKHRKSPHETVSAVIDGNQLKVVYGRPYTKDPKTGKLRKIWGELVPFDEIWRTGADEATLFTTQKAVVIGGSHVSAGTYSLYTLPMKDGSAKLVINKETGQWGTNYDVKKDLARVDLTKVHLDSPVDQFTIVVEKGASAGGVLKMSWDDTQYDVPFTVAKP